MRKIGTKISLITSISLIIVVTVLLCVSLAFNNQTVQEIIIEDCRNSANNLKTKIMSLSEETKLFAEALQGHAEFADYIEKSESTKAVEIAMQLSYKHSVDYLMIVLPDGTVFADTKMPERVGEKISFPELDAALKGTAANDLMRNDVLGFCAASTSPIKNTNGKILGAIIGMKAFDNHKTVDELKGSTALQYTIFSDKLRYSTTLVDKGEKILGTPAADNIYGQVKSGKEYVGKATILKEPYYATYLPLNNNAGAFLGMAFCGKNILSINQKTTRTSVFLIILSLVELIATVALLVVYIKKRIAEPLAKINTLTVRLQNGDIGITSGETFDLEINSKDEIGQMSNSLEKTSATLRSYIEEIIRILSHIENDDFTAETKIEYKNDFKPLGVMVSNISTNLSSIFKQIVISSQDVSSGAEQVSEGATSLAQGSTEQSSTIEQLSAGLLEVSEKIKNTAKNAENAKSKSLNAAKEVNNGNEQMTEMMKAMKDISTKSSQISKIIKSIDDIAFQTNILALNAAVEAARAGVAGKGFAVVADEVGNLASKSAASAKSTSELIASSITAVENGTKIATDTANSLDRIVVSVEETTKLIEEIADASSDEATSITTITTGIDQISAVVQTNSATSEESAATSQELASQARLLKELVSKFKLKNID